MLKVLFCLFYLFLEFNIMAYYPGGNVIPAELSPEYLLSVPSNSFGIKQRLAICKLAETTISSLTTTCAMFRSLNGGYFKNVDRNTYIRNLHLESQCLSKLSLWQDVLYAYCRLG